MNLNFATAAELAMTQQELLRAKLLPEETTKLLCAEIVALTETLCSITFVGPEGLVTEDSKNTGIMQFVEVQAKRNCLLALIQGSAETFAELARESTNVSVRD